MILRLLIGIVLSCSVSAGVLVFDAHALTDVEQQTWPPQPASSDPMSESAGKVREGDAKVGLLNLTNIELCSLQLAPAGSDKWTEDLLNGGSLKDGENIRITFPWGARSVWWDMRLYPKSGGACVEWKNIPAKRFRQLVLMVQDGKPVMRGE